MQFHRFKKVVSQSLILMEGYHTVPDRVVKESQTRTIYPEDLTWERKRQKTVLDHENPGEIIEHCEHCESFSWENPESATLRKLEE